MSEDVKPSLAITIGDQTFRVRIEQGEHARYERIAQTANRALREIVDGAVVGGQRAWAMTAFELAVELEDARESLRAMQRYCERLDSLIHRLDGALQAESKGGK